MNRETLIQLLNRIVDANDSEYDVERLIVLLEKHVSDPKILDYVFQDDMKPEDAVDKALSYRPILL